MKRPEHIKTAKQIGDDSWELMYFVNLPQNASAASQIEALKRDDNWQENHRATVSHQISALISDIEDAAQQEGK